MSNKEKKSWTEWAAEVSKKVDKVGIVAGLAMITYGFIAISGAAVTGGALLAGTSVVTHYVGERVRRSAEKRRKA